VRLLAISVDSPADSATFARREGIHYPLLADADRAVARAYVGVNDDDDTAVPGVVVIRGDGQIAFRQVATSKDDRLTAAQVLGEVDRALGTHGPDAAGPGYAPLDRLQLRLDAGGGAIAGRGTATASLAALAPLGHHAVAGALIACEPRAAPLDVDAAIGLRLPMLADAGAIELTGIGGRSLADATGWTAGGRVGLWFAVAPDWAIALDAGATAHRLGDADRSTELTVTLGIARLIRFRP